jgi:hypothetical protein
MKLLEFSKFSAREELLELLLETKLEYLDDFKNILREIDHPISKILLGISGKDLDIQFSYLGLGDKNDKVSFFDVNQIKKTKWVINNETLFYLNIDELNSRTEIKPIFLPMGTVGTIEKIWTKNDFEFNSGYSHLKGIFTLSPSIEIVQFLSDDGRKTFIHKNALRMIIESAPQTTSIGRITQKILKSNGENFTNKEVESFVTLFKSHIDILNNKLNFLEVVSGDDITFWYHEKNYIIGGGTLQGSCMRYQKCQRFFNIYTENPDRVSLLILKSEIDSSKIEARALIWKLDSGETFMDRIYYTKEEQANIFKYYAKSKGFIYKKAQSSGNSELIKDSLVYVGELNTTLESTEFSYYPYLDTLCFLKILRGGEGILQNDGRGSYDHILTRTDGRLECTRCGGDSEVDCPECDGRGDFSCYECDGDGQDECSSCDGSGEQNCDGCSGRGDVDCSSCDGSGETEGEDGEEEECLDCSGSGKEKCSECSGSGNQECSECSGDGKVTCGECYGSGRNECSECYGSGNVDCPDCN